MADNLEWLARKYGGVLPPSEEEKKAFKKWLFQTYGKDADRLIFREIAGRASYEANQYYQHWYQNIRGKPTSVVEAMTVEGTPLTNGAKLTTDDREGVLKQINKIRSDYGLPLRELGNVDTVESLTQELRVLEVDYPGFMQNKRRWEAEQTFGKEQLAQKDWQARQQAIQQTAWTRQSAAQMAVMAENQAIARLSETTPDNTNQLADQWEEWRRIFAQELKGQPRTWALGAQLGMKKNPYQRYYKNPKEEAQDARQQQVAIKQAHQDALKKAGEELKNATEAWGGASDRVSDAFRPIEDGDVIAAKQRVQDAYDAFNMIKDNPTYQAAMQTTEEFASKREKEWETNKGIPGTEAYWATPRPTREGGNMAIGEPESRTEPKLPEIPSDIAGYLQSPTWGAPVVTPSGQQYTSMPWSARERLAGYSEVMGKPWVETLEQMEIMQPRELRLGKRWQPARQMA